MKRAPVVDDEHDRPEVVHGDELGERLEVVLEGGGGVVGGVAEAVEVGSDAAATGGGELGHQRLPHPRALGEAVDADDGIARLLTRRPRFAVGEASLLLQLDPTHAVERSWCRLGVLGEDAVDLLSGFVE